MPVKTCCCVRDVLQGNKVIITVIIQRNLDTVRNINRFCQFEGSQFEFEHTLCIQRLIFSFLFSLQSIALSRSAAYQSVTPIAADVFARSEWSWDRKVHNSMKGIYLHALMTVKP